MKATPLTLRDHEIRALQAGTLTNIRRLYAHPQLNYLEIGDMFRAQESCEFIWTDKERDWHWVYRADGEPPYLPQGEVIRYRPPSRMPIKATRYFLKVASITMGRVRDVTEEEAQTQGFTPYETYRYIPGECVEEPDCLVTALEQYKHEWCRDFGRQSWVRNDPVVVIGMERVEKEELK